ncbi:MAG TPA: hypothetical protein VFW65_12215 [Pseudonocardiaceae bacterium]|nr:hypothetical protein [Pseudonocardiaceae bacterium]
MDLLHDEYATKLPCFLVYQQATREIDHFVELTRLTYLVTNEQLTLNPKASLVDGPDIPHDPGQFISHSDADDTVAKADLFGWVSFSQYSSLGGLPVEDVEGQAREGRLGRVRQHPKTKQDLVIWPPSAQLQPDERLPTPGDEPRMVVTVTLSGTAPLDTKALGDGEEGARNRLNLLLKLVHQLGDPDSVIGQAHSALDTGGFLQHWIAFEVFLKSTVIHMLRKHPEKLKRRRGGSKIDVEEILTWTDNFSSSMKQFQDNLIEHELAAMQAEQGSVHGAIRYLKDNFSFAADPYEAPYTHDHEERRTSYKKLRNLKDLRNTLVHEGDQTETDDSVEPVDYDEAVLVLKTIAYHIADMIISDEYNLR